MNQPLDPAGGPWSAATALRVEQVCDRFEAAWQAGQRPGIEDYLRDSAESEQPALLRELLAFELEYRRRAGENPTVNEYLARFPTQNEVIRAGFGPTTSPCSGPDCKEIAADRRLPTNGPRYRVLRLHARGGLGQVSVAHDEQLHREVALKQVRPERGDDPQMRRRFLAEAEITGQLQHPGVVPVYALEEGADGRPYYAMRFIEARTLAEAIAQYHADPTPLVFRGLLQRFVAVCQTLAYAHSKGVIHRDLKPANVMLGDYGETLVVDWGLAKRLGGSAPAGVRSQGAETGAPAGRAGEPAPQNVVYGPGGAGGLTEEGQVLGTPAYMAPEVAAGQAIDVGPAADVYALGAILFELLTGQAPYRGQGAEEVMGQVRQGPPPSPSRLRSGVPRALEAVCLKAMARPIADRYAGAADLAGEVDRWLADEPVAAHCEPVLVRLGRWRRRHKALVNALAAAVMVAGLFAGLMWWQKTQRVAQVERDAAAALAEAMALGKRAVGLTEQPAQWESTLAAALNAVKLAESLLAKEANAVEGDLWDKVQAGRAGLEADDRDRRLVALFEMIRLEQTEVDIKHNDFKLAEAYPRIRAALAGYGLAIGQTSPEQAVARLLQRHEAIRSHLVAVLDFCLHYAPSANTGDRRWLREVLLAADTDPWRRQVRLALSRGAGRGLQRLIRGLDARKQPPAFLVLLAIRFPRGSENIRLGLLRRAQQAHPGDFWANHTLAFALENSASTRWEEVARYFTAALALRPENPGAYVNLGEALRRKGDLAGAIAAHRQAIALSPAYAAAHNNLGAALRAKGDQAGAIAAYRQAIRLEKNYPDAHFNLGVALQTKGRLEEAIAAYRQAIRLRKEDAQAHNNLGNALADLGRLEEAIVAYRQAICFKKDDALAYYNLGNAFRQKGRLEEAITAYRQAIRLKKDLAEAHTNLGIALHGQGRLAEAIAAHEEAIRLRKDDAHAYFNLGLALRKGGRVEEAITAYRQAIRLKKNYAKAHYSLGNALSDQGRLGEAIAAYREAIRLKKDFALAHHTLGNTLLAQGQLAEAVVEFRRAITLDPKIVAAHYNLGHVLYQQGRLARATLAFRRAIALDPKFAKAHGALGHTLIQLGRFGEAQQATVAFLHLLPTGHPLRPLALGQLRRCERLVKLEAKLPAVLSGQAQPAGPTEQLELAQLCRLKRRYATGVQFFADAFAARPELTADIKVGRRYNAACVAALAGCGRGEDEAELDAKEKTRLRGQALKWLRFDLALWGEQVTSGKPSDLQAAQQTLRHWQHDPDLAAVRDPGALAKLPEAERKEWTKFWSEVAALRAQSVRKK
jgi:tetratricopeptide (TPR) repeat protein/serine/threonine protein kinase